MSHAVLSPSEKPVCILKVELDGENVEHIKVYRKDNPEEVVQAFGDRFNLSDTAQQKLLDQIIKEIH
jgi:hypothetical protein